jgi:hypothetical protein
MRAAAGHLWTLPVWFFAAGLGRAIVRRPAPASKATFILQRGMLAFGLPTWLFISSAQLVAKAGYDASRITLDASDLLSAALFILVAGVWTGEVMWARRP